MKKLLIIALFVPLFASASDARKSSQQAPYRLTGSSDEAIQVATIGASIILGEEIKKMEEGNPDLDFNQPNARQHLNYFYQQTYNKIMVSLIKD